MILVKEEKLLKPENFTKITVTQKLLRSLLKLFILRPDRLSVSKRRELLKNLPALPNTSNVESKLKQILRYVFIRVQGYMKFLITPRSGRRTRIINL